MMAARTQTPESGNVLFFILLAIALIGLVTAAMRSGGSENANIDSEQLLIKVTQVKRYADELERATAMVYQNTRSESDISFAYTTAHSDYGTYETNPGAEVFHVQGGGAGYTPPPAGINDGSMWEFYGTSAAPDVGTNAADLIAVLPNVTPEFCTAMNRTLDQTGAMEDTGACVYDASGTRFAGTFSLTPNTFNAAGFTVRPAPRGCVTCTASGTRHYYHVLMRR